jgi:hypothetical protein
LWKRGSGSGRERERERGGGKKEIIEEDRRDRG